MLGLSDIGKVVRWRPERGKIDLSGSAQKGAGNGAGEHRDTEVKITDNSLVGSKRGQFMVENRTDGRSAPTTVNSSVRTREYLTTVESSA